MKNLTIVILAVILIGVVGGFLYLNYGNSTNISGQAVKTVTSNGITTANSNNANSVREITLDAKKFEYTPSTITIKKG